MILMLGMFGTALPALLAIPDERPVFLREYSTNHYSVISYFAARFFVEAIITFLQVFLIVSLISVSAIKEIINDSHFAVSISSFRL